MFLRLILIVSIIGTIIYAMMVYHGTDRLLRLATTPLQQIAAQVRPTPPGERRIVAILRCHNDEPPSEITIKSILNQSIGVSEIAVETTASISDDLSKVVVVHKPGTMHLREGERDTLLLLVENGCNYEYDWVETAIMESSSR